jgi:2,4-dienoyl-CoA reductase-like NADH-dependent reductase (Old Yellow Enzyme family)/thioredoxin reductase
MLLTEQTGTPGHNTKPQPYLSLKKPGLIGDLRIKNRTIMAAMGNSLADEKGNVTEAMLEYYKARARGGVGMVITQFAAISPDDVIPYNLGLYEDKFIPGLRRLVQLIQESGAKTCVQLMHPGMLFLLFKTIPSGVAIKVPSLVPGMAKDTLFQLVTSTDIEQYIIKFGEAASRAISAGADAIEIHACHGCLLSTFLSPAINRRTDAYGGNVENRARFVQQIVENLRQRTGPQFPIIVRINGSDDVAGGVTLNEVIRQTEIFSQAGASAISISSGMEYWSTLMAPSYLTPRGIMVPIAEEVKKKVNIPVIVSGKIDPDLAERTITEGRADFIALGRPLLADPELPNKLFQINREEISACLYCNNCLRTSWRSCTINPFLYRESAAHMSKTTSPKKIMVIGGGLAGMEAAVLCKLKGHSVSLFEKEGALGGQWKVACAVPGKQGYASLIQHLENKINQLQIPVTLNTQVTRNLVNSLKPDAAIIATGAIPQDVAIPGTNPINCVQANDVITGKVVARGRTTVIGGNMVAMEAAVLLAQQGHTVTLISHGILGGRKGPDDMITFRGLLRRILSLRIPLYLNCEVIEMREGSLMVRFEQEILSWPADTIVLAIGVKPVDSLISELKGIVPEIYPVGDCMLPGNAAQATYSAARLAQKIG